MAKDDHTIKRVTEPAAPSGRQRQRRARIASPAGRSVPLTTRIAASFSGALGRTVLVLVAILVLATAGPVLLRAITASAVSVVPQPAVSATKAPKVATAAATAVVGQPCPQRGVAGKDAAGRAVTCLPKSKAVGAALVWTRRA